MIWNPGDPDSAAIKAAYQQLHPNVIYFALEDGIGAAGIDYDDYPPNSQVNPLCSGCSDCGTCSMCNPSIPAECLCCSCPTLAVGVWVDSQNQSLGWAMNQFYITPSMYEQFVAAPLRSFLVDYATTHPEPSHEPILAFVTTRGVPATISESFQSAVNHSNACIMGSVESHLAALNYAGRGHPFFGHLGTPFKTWINREATVCEPDGGLEFKGKIFLTSRLDSDRQFDCDLEPTGTYVDAVLALIQRSNNLYVEKFASTIVIDSKDDMFSDAARTYGNYLRDRRWCVYYEHSTAFTHGVYQLETNPTDCGLFDWNEEGQHVAYWHVLAHYTLGRNVYAFGGPETEPVCNNYVKWYNPHPAGLFLSHESYNGIALRDPNWPYASDLAGPGWTHGSVLQWIGRGGGFTIGGVNGMGSPPGTYAIPNLYEFGLSWGEAAWSESIAVKSFACPIGDPLARVVVYDADLDTDGEVDADDLAIIIAHMGQQVSEGDINQDGIVNEVDFWLAYQTQGRSATGYPELPPQIAPWPPVPTPIASRCGDLTGNGVVDSEDLTLFDDRVANCGYLYAGMFDVNHDYAISQLDRQIIVANSTPPHCMLDATGDGCLAQDDNDIVNLWVFQWGSICDPEDEHWIPGYDVNCDGCIDEQDYEEISAGLKHAWQCPTCTNP